MSKYKCNSCDSDAYFIDFFKNKSDLSPDAVYTHCKACGKEAWGGFRFHPEMNELFNKLFTPNFAYDSSSAGQFGRTVILQESGT